MFQLPPEDVDGRRRQPFARRRCKRTLKGAAHRPAYDMRDGISKKCSTEQIRDVVIPRHARASLRSEPPRDGTEKPASPKGPRVHGGAEDQNRTGDTRFFRPVLYRLSYLGSTQLDMRIVPAAPALPVGRSRWTRVPTRERRNSCEVATLMGLEPTTSAVTGRRSNQLSYNATAGVVGTVGIEPTPLRV